MNKITLSCYNAVPPIVEGYVRDFRVRWALEELGLPYEEMIITHEEKKSPAYKKLQPFSQVPIYREGDLELFESGAIVMHIAEKSEKLMPRDPVGRARTQCWIFAALNSIEPMVWELARIDFFKGSEEWMKLQKPFALEMVRMRLGDLSKYLEGREYLEDRFTAGDLMTASVLRIMDVTDTLKEWPNLVAYKERCLSRPAFKKALEAQLKVFKNSTSKTS